MTRDARDPAWLPGATGQCMECSGPHDRCTAPTRSVRRIPAVLSIAGSDSSGGAGIQADIKTMLACGVFAMTAITALSAQNTLGVTAIAPVPYTHLRAHETQANLVCRPLLDDDKHVSYHDA